MGVILLIAGIVGFFYFGKNVSLLETDLGIIGRGLDAALESQYQQIIIAQMSALALGIIGIVSLIYGFVKK
jgi:hypothetical protein